MLGRRRQSVHGFGQLSPQKLHGPFGRTVGSSHGRAISPRTSSNNLGDSTNRLSSLTEAPGVPDKPPAVSDDAAKPSHEGANGVTAADSPADVALSRVKSNGANGAPGGDASNLKTGAEAGPTPTKDARFATAGSPSSDSPTRACSAAMRA